jgi:putative phage-type endonuclease
METDSTYTPNETESEEETDISSISETSDIVSWADYLDETDALELEIQVYETAHELAEETVGKMHMGKYHNEFTDEIANNIYDTCIDADLAEESDYRDIHQFVKERVQVYFDTISQIPARSLSSCRILHKPNIHSIRDKIMYLQNIPQPKQRTTEWYEFRHNLMTASSIGKIFSTESQINQLIYEKCRPLDYTIGNVSNYVNTESPMHWGNKYEPLTLMWYEKTYNTKVADFGCIRHAKYEFIGASPDGINVDTNSLRYGRMIEVKNIVNREITGIPLDAYWVQMQLQMETCDLDECDFIETQFKEYADEGAFYADFTTSNRGIILHFSRKGRECGPIDNSPHYEYMPLNIPIEKKAINDWIQAKTQEIRAEYTLYTTLYWYLDDFSCILVQRNRQWFAESLPKIRETWSIIEKERISGYEHRMPKKKQNQPIVITTMNRENKQIKNLHISNSVCLIKLDE